MPLFHLEQHSDEEHRPSSWMDLGLTPPLPDRKLEINVEWIKDTNGKAKRENF